MPFSSPWQIDIPDMSVVTMLFQSPSAPLSNEPLFIDADEPDTHYLTLSTYRLWAQRLALGLKRAGLRPGDRVLVFSTNSIYYPVAIIGTIMAGGIFTGSSSGYTARELAHHMRDADPTFVLAFPGGLETCLKVAAETGVPRTRVFVFDGQGTAPHVSVEYMYGVQTSVQAHWSTLLASEADARGFAWDPCNTRELAAGTTVALNYSSGTTGLPKGVEITHRNYVTNLLQIKDATDRRLEGPLQPGETRQLCFLPMNHAMAQILLAMGTPAWGGRVYIMPRFDFVQMLRCIARFRITSLTLVPPVVVAMTKSPLLRGREGRGGEFDLSSVQSVGTGAAPIGPETMREFTTLWPESTRIKVRNGYGQSEATCTITAGDLDADSRDIGTVGQLVANIEGKLVDDQGQEVAEEYGAGTRGELWVKAPNVMKGYWRNEAATRATITPDGWLRTGDVCELDERQRVYVVDRKKELIKVKGNQVAPGELEALLLEHPAVADAAVIGVPFGEDEAPRAYVQLKEEMQGKTSGSEIATFVEERISKSKRLAGGVVFVTDGIPKNPSGKILRKVLRERAQRESTATPKL